MGSVQITAGSGTPIRTLSNPAFDSGAAVQVFTPADALGNLNPSDPDGTQNFTTDPSTLLLDSFDVSLANFTTGGTAPTVGSSAATFASSTTASASSTLRTNGQFLLRAGSYLRAASYVRLEAAAVTNTTRYWGLGTAQGSPTAAAPLLNGAFFQVDYADGALYAVTYNAGTVTKIAPVGGSAGQALTRPTDGLQHRYDVWYRQTVTYWLIDGLVVATRAAPSLGSWQSPYWVAGQVNFTTGPSTAPTLVISAVSVADTGGHANTLADGVNGYLQQTVKAPSTAAAATDLPAVVALHPTSPLPAGTNALGSVTVTGTTAVSLATNTPTLAAGTNTVGRVLLPTGTDFLLTTTAGTNATLLSATAASLAEVQVWNPTTSACWVKFYRKASAPSVGTDVPFYTIAVAAGTATAPIVVERQFPPVGKRFSTGLSFAVTGAAADTDTTATVAGIRVTGTYI